jgi:hypothetical protein
MNLDKLRFTVCALTLLGLCLYSGVVGPTQVDTISEILANTVAFVSQEVKLGAGVRVVRVLSREIEVEQRQARIIVRVPQGLEKEWEEWRSQLKVGDDVTLRGVYHPEGYLLLTEMHVHKGRPLKIGISLAALLLLAGMLFHKNRKTAPAHA